MPELPEVEVVRRGLLPYALGYRIEHVDVRDPRSLRHHRGGAGHFAQTLQGCTVVAIARRGKFLWWRLLGEDGMPTPDALVTHLGMSGQLRVDTADRGISDVSEVVSSPAESLAGRSSAEDLHEGPASDPRRHLKIRFSLRHPETAATSTLDFIDQRIFGGMWTSPLVGNHEDPPSGQGSPDGLLPAAAEHIARDVLDPHFDRSAVVAAWGSRRAPIKALLLNQSSVSGIGNIYADEALWMSRIRYDSPSHRISPRKRGELLDSAAEVMRRALEVGGTSFDSLYVNVDGRRGYFARSLSAYGHEGQPCPRCHTPIVRAKFSNRSSFFCPRCQRRR